MAENPQESSKLLWISLLIPIALVLSPVIGYQMLFKPNDYDDILSFAKKTEAEGKNREKDIRMAQSDSEDDEDKSPKDDHTLANSQSGHRLDTSESGHGTDEIVFISIIAFREKHGILPGEQIIDEGQLLELYSLAHQFGGYADSEIQLSEEIWKLQAASKAIRNDEAYLEDYIEMVMKNDKELDDIFDVNCSTFDAVGDKKEANLDVVHSFGARYLPILFQEDT